jgi:hypothetical protein
MVYFESVAWAVRCDANNGRADESRNVLALILGGYTKSFFETGVDETDNIGRQLSQDDVVGHRVEGGRESVTTKSPQLSTFQGFKSFNPGHLTDRSSLFYTHELSFT